MADDESEADRYQHHDDSRLEFSGVERCASFHDTGVVLEFASRIFCVNSAFGLQIRS